MSIRDLVRTDRPAWNPLWDGYNAFYGREGATALPAEITEATWSRLFDPAEPVHGLVFERDGHAIGLVHYLFHRSTTQLGPVCYLQDLYTLPAARGQGVGRALIEAVYARAQAAGSRRVYWHTQESNAAARRLYDQVTQASGFIVYAKAL